MTKENKMSLGEPQYPRKPFWWEYPDNQMITIIMLVWILIPISVVIYYLV